MCLHIDEQNKIQDSFVRQRMDLKLKSQAASGKTFELSIPLYGKATLTDTAKTLRVPPSGLLTIQSSTYFNEIERVISITSGSTTTNLSVKGSGWVMPIYVKDADTGKSALVFLIQFVKITAGAAALQDEIRMGSPSVVPFMRSALFAATDDMELLSQQLSFAYNTSGGSTEMSIKKLVLDGVSLATDDFGEVTISTTHSGSGSADIIGTCTYSDTTKSVSCDYTDTTIVFQAVGKDVSKAHALIFDYDSHVWLVAGLRHQDNGFWVFWGIVFAAVLLVILLGIWLRRRRRRRASRFRRNLR